ncbi:MAG: DNA topoisomerase [Culicoidibacterales bacterium]
MRVFFCEKPSQARAVAEAIAGGYEKNDGYLVGYDNNIYTYAFGHLTTLVSPETVNENFSWKGELKSFPHMVQDIPMRVIDDSGVSKQFKIISKLFKDCDEIIVSTDAGREGEHIFRTVYELAKVTKPCSRMWLRDMTTTGIEKAYAERKNSAEYNSLALSAKLRAEADWLIGMNLTIFGSRTLNARFSLGRVQTPTLAMIVNRELEIANFKKETTYTVESRVNEVSFQLVIDENTTFSKEQAQSILDSLHIEDISAFTCNTKEILESSPKLFDLTELQKIANKQLNFTASETLDLAQKLYEKQLITYPRTSSQYLASNDGVQERAKNLGHTVIIENNWEMNSSFINPQKVTDHEAIIPTGIIPSQLTDSEQQIFDLIATRFLASFYPKAKKEKIEVSFQCETYQFKATDTVILALGYLELIGGENKRDSPLKQLKKEDIHSFSMKELVSKPKSRYTDSSLLSDMKNASKFIDDEELVKVMKQSEAQGIGTPATRASIIENLLKKELMSRSGKQLLPTTKGMELIQKFKTLDFALISPKLTAELELLLDGVVNGITTQDDVYHQIQHILTTSVEQLKTLEVFETEQQNQAIATCPKCNSDILENSRSYYCSNYKSGCKVSVWKNGLEKMGKKTITKKEAKALLEGKAPAVKLLSKAGKSYEAPVKYNPENNYLNVIFDK